MSVIQDRLKSFVFVVVALILGIGGYVPSAAAGCGANYTEECGSWKDECTKFVNGSCNSWTNGVCNSEKKVCVDFNVFDVCVSWK